MDIAIERGGLRDAAGAEYRYKAILLDVTYADPQSVGHMRADSANRDGLAASKSEAHTRSHYARPGQVSLDERSYKLATLVESFGRLGKEGSDLIDQMAASIVGGTDGSSLSRKGVCKQRIFQIISVITQVAISRRIRRYHLALGDRQATRGTQEVNGVPLPVTWRWSIVEE